MSIPIYNLQDGNINQGSIDSHSHSSTLYWREEKVSYHYGLTRP